MFRPFDPYNTKELEVDINTKTPLVSKHRRKSIITRRKNRLLTICEVSNESNCTTARVQLSKLDLSAISFVDFNISEI